MIEFLIELWPLYSALITATYQFIFFLITVFFHSDKVTDLAGSSNFFILAVLGLIAAGSYFPRQVVLSGMVCAWAIRLGAFLLMRVLLRKKDARFDKMRESPIKLAGFWTLQAIWVYVTSLPVTFINFAYLSNVELDAVDYIGWSLWGIGFLIESLADWQRHRFNLHKRSRKPFLDTGLWQWSRHPNYFGEIVLWFGIWLSASNGLWSISPAMAIVSLLSPILTFLLLTFVSGIPLAEERADKKNHRSMAYKQYKFCTSPLIPLPCSWYAKLPVSVKRWVFFDRYQLAFITPTNTSSPTRSHSLNSSPRSSSSSTTTQDPRKVRSW